MTSRWRKFLQNFTDEKKNKNPHEAREEEAKIEEDIFKVLLNLNSEKIPWRENHEQIST